MGRGRSGFKGQEVGIDLHARVGGIGPKIENGAAGARFLRTNCEGPLDWVKGNYLVRGKLGFKCQEAGIDPRARVGGFRPKCGNRAVGAWFSQTTCGGAHIWVEGT